MESGRIGVNPIAIGKSVQKKTYRTIMLYIQTDPTYIGMPMAN
jgi:hypothetical protein